MLQFPKMLRDRQDCSTVPQRETVMCSSEAVNMY